ncbi:hypothetical protein GRB31_20675 (plasmid) [Ralstonia solanacearum]|nr:hypothetical protein GRB31_20675 [Ralstonia solanacearum]
MVSVGDVAYRVVDLPAMFGKTLERLPVVLRLLLENTLRNTEGRERQRAVEGLLRWLETGMSEEEIAFQPARVLMHDTTSTPALVDIAAIRDALAPGEGGRWVPVSWRCLRVVLSGLGFPLYCIFA